MGKLLSSLGYRETTINDNPNWKDGVYGHPAYDVSISVICAYFAQLSLNAQTIGGMRGGPVATYLRTAKSRPNFTLRINSYVTNVIRNKGQITGVRTNDTSVYTLSPKGRVILSAGSFGTPRILFRSGVGPNDMLQIVKGHATAGPLLPRQSDWIDLPVGYNVMDNPSIKVSAYSNGSLCVF